MIYKLQADYEYRDFFIVISCGPNEFFVLRFFPLMKQLATTNHQDEWLLSTK